MLARHWTTTWTRARLAGACVVLATLTACGGAGGGSTLSSSVSIGTTGGGGSGGGGSGGGGSGAPTVTVSLLAGVAAAGINNGAGATALFNAPSGVATDSAGNIYIADTYNQVIRKVTPAGFVSTLAGNPSLPTSALACWQSTATCGDGTGSSASFHYPTGIVYDALTSSLYVTDQGSYAVRQVTLGGVVTTVAGTPGINGGSDGPYGLFGTGLGPIAVDGTGNIWVTDRTSYTTIRKITPTPGGATASTVATVAGGGNIPYTYTAGNRTRGGSYSYIDAIGTAAAFSQYVTDIAFDKISGKLFIVDRGANAAGTGHVAIRVLDPETAAVTTYAGGCADPAPASANPPLPAQLPCSPVVQPILPPANNVGSIAFDNAGNLYVYDADYTIQVISPTGVVATLTGTSAVQGSSDGSGSTATLSGSGGIAYDRVSGGLYLTDSLNNTVRTVALAGDVTTLAGVIASGYADGPSSSARFNFPGGVATNAAGDVYVADTGNSTIRRITPTGMVSTLAGTAGVSGAVDGTGLDASFSMPYGLAVNGAGNIYVADLANQVVRMVTPTGDVTTVAGQVGIAGADDGNGLAATFNVIYGVAIDRPGNIYVTDTQNSNIRKISPTGDVTTLAGPSATSAATPGTTGAADGTGTDASFNAPTGIVFDPVSGNLYVADSANSVIRKVTLTGVVTTLAGMAGVPDNVDGTGSAARFWSPSGIATDSAGNIYVSDTGNDNLRKITPSGVVTTIVVNPGSAARLPVQFVSPSSIAIFGDTLYATSLSGIVYIANLP